MIQSRTFKPKNPVHTMTAVPRRGSAGGGHAGYAVVRSTDSALNQANENRKVILTKDSTKSIGLTIGRCTIAGGYKVLRLAKGSPAMRSGQLQVGDLIETINGMRIKDLEKSHVDTIIKSSPDKIVLGLSSFFDDDTARKLPFASSESNHDPISSSRFQMKESDLIEALKNMAGIGCYFCHSNDEHTEIVVKSILKGSPADQDGRIKVGYVVVSVNSKIFIGRSLPELAMALLGPPGTPVRIVLRTPMAPSRTPVSGANRADASGYTTSYIDVTLFRRETEKLLKFETTVV